jgi:hypothetical protein
LLYSIPVSVSGSRVAITVLAALAAIRAAVVLPGAAWNCFTQREASFEELAPTAPTRLGDNPGPSDLVGFWIAV